MNFDDKRPSAEDRKEIFARVVQIAVIVLMTTHSYSFGGKLFKQKRGTPIGLRASACLLMIQWDSLWAGIQMHLGLKVHIVYHYVDDIRIYLRPISTNWSWSRYGWLYVSGDGNDLITHTKDMLHKSFEQIFRFSKFTTETQDEYNGLMLPTLYFKTQTQV